MVVDEVYSSNWYFVFLVEQGKTWAQTLKGACMTNFFFLSNNLWYITYLTSCLCFTVWYIKVRWVGLDKWELVVFWVSLKFQVFFMNWGYAHVVSS